MTNRKPDSFRCCDCPLASISSVQCPCCHSSSIIGTYSIGGSASSEGEKASTSRESCDVTHPRPSLAQKPAARVWRADPAAQRERRCARCNEPPGAMPQAATTRKNSQRRRAKYVAGQRTLAHLQRCFCPACRAARALPHGRLTNAPRLRAPARGVCRPDRRSPGQPGGEAAPSACCFQPAAGASHHGRLPARPPHITHTRHTRTDTPYTDTCAFTSCAYTCDARKHIHAHTCASHMLQGDEGAPTFLPAVHPRPRRPAGRPGQPRLQLLWWGALQLGGGALGRGVRVD